MAFVPRDPTANESIGSFTVNIFDLALNGNVKYLAPVDEHRAAIVFEFKAADDIKDTVADILGVGLDQLSIEASGSSETAQIMIEESADYD